MFTLWKTWRGSKAKLPNYLVKGRGKQLDAIASRLIQAIDREKMQGVNVALAGGSPNVANVNRPLRVLSHFGYGHLGATDVTFRAEGTDLFVRFQSLPRTLISYLRAALYVVVFLLAYAMVMSLYLFGSGAFDSWVTDYAQKHSSEVFVGQDRHDFYKGCIKDGYYKFDNNVFVAEMAASGGDKLLDEVVKAETGGRSAMSLFVDGFDGPSKEEVGKDKAVNMFDAKAANEASQRMSVGVSFMLLDSMGTQAPAYMAFKALENRGSDEFFWWYKPEMRFVVLFTDVMGTDSIWYAKNVDFKSVFIHDVGNETPRHRELTAKMTAALNKSITFIRPWSAAKLFHADPKLAMLSLGGPSTIVAMLIGGGLLLLPMSILHWPCHVLGWPTYEEFTNAVNSRNAWVERVLSDMLMNDFGVQEQDRFTVMNQ